MSIASGSSLAISGSTTWVGKFGETPPRTDGSVAPKGGSTAAAGTENTDEAATNVSLSPQAKAMLERQQVDQAVADKLDAALHPDKDAKGPKDLTFDDLIVPTGIITPPDDAFGDGDKPVDAADKPLKAVEMTPELKKSMINAMQSLLVHGVAARNPEAAVKLQEAIDNGTARIRKADDVPGVNTHTTVTYTKGPGGGWGMSTSKTSNPSPEIQAEIDSGHATTMWNINQGDLYITW